MKATTSRKAEQLPNGHLFVGIDVHKGQRAAVVMDERGRVRAKVKVSTDRKGFEDLVSFTTKEAQRAGALGVAYGIEAGSHLWMTLSQYFEDREEFWRLINPLTLKRRREGDDLTRRKSDYRDAQMAAELLRTGHYTETTLLEGDWAELRAAHGAYERLGKERTGLVNLLRSRLDCLFPEFCRVWKTPTGLTALAVLACGLTPAEIAGMGLEEFTRLVEGRFEGQRLHGGKVREVHERAKESVGVREGARMRAWEVVSIVERLRLALRQLAQVRGQMVALARRQPESQYVVSIEGLGETLTAELLAELGPMTRYHDAKALVKLAGTNPEVKESAGKSSRYTPLSKRGRAKLRTVLWQAAARLLKGNADFKVWAEALRTRAKNPLARGQVMGAAMNKLLRLIWALVTGRRMYRSLTTGPEAMAA